MQATDVEIWVLTNFWKPKHNVIQEIDNAHFIQRFFNSFNFMFMYEIQLMLVFCQHIDKTDQCMASFKGSRQLPFLVLSQSFLMRSGL